MSGAFYGRYIPPSDPKVPTTHKIAPRSSVAAPNSVTNAPDLYTPPKKSKDEAKGTPSAPPRPIVVEAQDEQNHFHVDGFEELSVKSKKPKKRKRDSHTDGQANEEEGVTPKKHKAVLSKFQKSARRAEASRNAATETVDDTTQDGVPQGQLHGKVHS
jgi:ATP-dependent RNA helicase DDX51/DBP6